MKILRTRRALIQYRSRLKGSVGFVPTMGALHAGHLSLVNRARRESDHVMVSIFVNPTQFGPKEDFRKYPRTLKKDLALLRAAKCDAVFAPRSVTEVYARTDETKITARPSLTSRLEGTFRPGHFDGVCTVVFKLFSWVRPARAYFGLKDFQQVQVVKAMVEDLEIPVDVIECETLREETGLAMSSRNVYLSERARRSAAVIYRALSTSRSLVQARRIILREGLKIQYLESWMGRWLFAGMIDGVRLIDNVAKK